VARHRSVRGVVLPAAMIAGLLVAASTATYAVIRVHERTAAGTWAGVGGQTGQPGPGSGRPGQPGRARSAPAGSAGLRSRRPGSAHSPGSAHPPGSLRRPHPLPLPRPTALPRPSLPTGTSPGRSTEAAELGQVAALLRRSAAVRSVLDATTRAIASCQLPSGAGLSRLKGVIVTRTGLLESAAATQVAAVPGGGRLQASLVDAMRFSLAADTEFAAWAADVGNAGDSCPVPTLSDSSFQTALTDSALASAAKAQFLQQWNQLAAASGEPAFRGSQI
jgi:hypothetical protein